MNLADQPWTKVRDAVSGERPVVAILPCGATEAHGPHLPLNTDVIISEGMACRAAVTLNQGGVATFVLPSLAYAPAEYAAEHAGTIGIGASAAKLTMLDIARGLKAQGFACLAIANSHFDPANVAMLRDASVEMRTLGVPVAFPDFTRRALAQTLTEEFISSACHAGQFETSLIIADRPELVDDAMRRALTPNPSSLVEAFKRGAKTFAEAGGPDAYFGNPRGATAEEGEQSFRIMADALCTAIREAIKSLPAQSSALRP